jgi:hypothetical protein
MFACGLFSWLLSYGLETFILILEFEDGEDEEDVKNGKPERDKVME